MRYFKMAGIVVGAIVLALGVTVVAGLLASDRESDAQQSQLQPFYTLPNPLPGGNPGDVIRYEPMTDLGWRLTGANAYRMLYLSEAPAGELRVSSGMIFIPTAPAKAPRPVVAYAHGTSGFGDACAPSRTTATPAAMPWVQTMIDNGWVLTTTDYVGLGTDGTPYYLIGQSEAADVVNSVRAARNFPAAGAGARYAVMGHSQGGHSALWTGELSAKIAPELTLLGVAASAPAAELGPLVSASWDIPNAWALGPDVMVSWPQVYPDLTVSEVSTPDGLSNYEATAYKCVQTALLEGQVDFLINRVPFAKDPSTVPSWRAALAEQTPRPLPASLPVSVTAGTADGLVFPSTQALLQQKWCRAGSNLRMNWLGALATGFEAGPIAHGNTVLFAWPEMTNWIQERFQNRPAVSNCGTTPPVPPPAP